MNGLQRCILIFGAFLVFAVAGLVAYVALYLPVEAGAAVQQAAAAPVAPSAPAPENGFIANAAPQLRAYCGTLQWFDGARWNDLDSLAALSALDPFFAYDAAPASADIPASGAEETAETQALRSRMQGNVPQAGGGGSSGGGGGGGGSSGGGGGGAEWSGDYE